jgi:hypothetical protein
MSTFTETDFRLLFESSEQFDEWLATQFLEVRQDGPVPGVWMHLRALASLPQLEAGVLQSQHPQHDLSAPVLPFPFEMAAFLALADSDCFKHSSARWPTDAAVVNAQTINPRTKALMMELQGHPLPAPQVAAGAPPCSPPAGPVEARPVEVSAPGVITAKSSIGSDRRWTEEMLSALDAFRTKHGTKAAADKFNVSAARVRSLLPRNKPKPTPFSAITRRLAK